MRYQNYSRRVQKTADALSDKIVANSGRWCEVTLKKTGETITVMRESYGPMERPMYDEFNIEFDGGKIIEFKNLLEVAQWMCNRS